MRENRNHPRIIFREARCLRIVVENYTRILLSIIGGLNRETATAENVKRQLAERRGDSSEWPSDQAFRVGWESRNAYSTLNNPKMVHVLKRLSDAYMGPKHEQISVDGPLTIEHIMPQGWIEHWPLARRFAGPYGSPDCA